MPLPTLSGALAALMSRRGGGSGAPVLVPLSQVRENGEIITGTGATTANTFMTNDEPQFAGTQEWVLTADDGTVIGLGAG